MNDSTYCHSPHRIRKSIVWERMRDLCCKICYMNNLSKLYIAAPIGKKL